MEYTTTQFSGPILDHETFSRGSYQMLGHLQRNMRVLPTCPLWQDTHRETRLAPNMHTAIHSDDLKHVGAYANRTDDWGYQAEQMLLSQVSLVSARHLRLFCCSDCYYLCCSANLQLQVLRYYIMHGTQSLCMHPQMLKHTDNEEMWIHYSTLKGFPWSLYCSSAGGVDPQEKAPVVWLLQRVPFKENTHNCTH